MRAEACARQVELHGPPPKQFQVTPEEFEVMLAEAQAKSRALFDANWPEYRERKPAKTGTAKYRRKQRKRGH